MKLNDAGMALIERWEGFRSKPYLDQGGLPTIGYGTTVYPNGKKVAMSDAPIPKKIAIAYKRHDLNKFIKAVTGMLAVKLSENRFSALVSFAYNAGSAALKGSTLLKVVNEAPGAPGIRDEFMKWNKVSEFVNGKKTGRKIVSNGLTNRRRAEADLYFTS